MFWRHVVVPNQVNRQLSTVGARYNLSLIHEESLSLSGYEHNTLFHNAGAFFEVGSVVGVDSILDGRGVARGDLDNDGDLDLVVSNRNYPHITVLRNDHPAGNHFIAVVLQGTRSNRMGIGARVSVACSGRSQVRLVSLGEGFLSQSETTAWFGLGDCRQIERLTIAWPSGARQTFDDVPVDQKLVFIEGQPGWAKRALEPRNHTLVQPERVRLPTAGELPPLAVPAPAWTLPRVFPPPAYVELHYEPGGTRGDLPATLLINFWATWCAVCHPEMQSLIEHHPAFEKLGVGIIGISVDESASVARHHAKTIGVPYPIVHDRGAEVFRSYVDALDLGSGSVPLSVLIQDGIVRNAYLGRVDPKEILEAIRSIRRADRGA